jgi:hypothetical protein
MVGMEMEPITQTASKPEIRLRKVRFRDLRVGDRVAFNHAPSLHEGWRFGTVVEKSWAGPTYSTIKVRFDPYDEPELAWKNTDRYLVQTLLTVVYHLERGHLRKVIAP